MDASPSAFRSNHHHHRRQHHHQHVNLQGAPPMVFYDFSIPLVYAMAFLAMAFDKVSLDICAFCWSLNWDFNHKWPFWGGYLHNIRQVIWSLQNNINSQYQHGMILSRSWGSAFWDFRINLPAFFSSSSSCTSSPHGFSFDLVFCHWTEPACLVFTFAGWSIRSNFNTLVYF